MEYKIKLSKNDFFKINNKIYSTNVEIIDDYILLNTNKKTLILLKNNKINYEIIDSNKIKIINLFKNNYYLLFGLLFLFSIIYINTYKVSKITFTNDTPINKTISKEIENNLTTLFLFKFSNIDYINYSKELQIRYIEYPYINVYKNNDEIVVDIKKELNNIDKTNYQIGKIISTYDAIVDSIYTTKGNKLVNKNTYVKKGDELIDGKLTGCQGMILGYVFENVNLKIEKQNKITNLTGNTNKYNSIDLFSLSFDLNKSNYQYYDRFITIKFNFFDFFKIKEIEDYQKDVIIKTNSQTDALEYAKNLINIDFECNRVSDKEKIIDIKEVSSKEDENYYNFKLIIKKLISIGEFVRA